MPAMLAAEATVTLRLLGGAAATGPDAPVLGRGVRGRRLALLAVLAVARGRPVGRDKLLGVLWPDASPERARPLLSDAVYQVRGTLGDDACLTTGDDLTLNPDRVNSDVGQFERALASGDLEGAVALYGGPFLDGFHVEDAGEFERWVDGERARLAARFADALGRLAAASEASGDWAGAVRWLQRLAAHDPYDGRAAARLMRALNAAGNRAAALQHARVHAALLRAEFDAEPDEEVQSLAERLRAEPAPAAAPLPAPVQVTVAAAPVASTPAVAAPAVAPHAPSTVAAAPATDAAPIAVPAQGPGEPARARPLPVLAALASAPRCDAPPPPVRRAMSRAGWWTLALGAALVAVLAPMTLSANLRTDAGAAEGAAPPAEARGAPRGAARSIAVLPFEELGPARPSSYFSDGLTEEIIGMLGRVDGLRVAARSSSFALRGAPLPAPRIGDTLGVETLLEGSVRRVNGRVRVAARLIDARDGFQLWSDSYDRAESDLMALQHDIASAIVGRLQLELAPASREDALRPAGSAEVYDLYLRGIFARNKLTGEELARAVDFFDRAIRLDSSYAPAWAGKATAIGPMIWFGHLSRAQGAPLMRAAARRAVALDSTLVEGQVALGMTHFFVEWDWPAAERAYRRAIALNPNHALSHHFLANYLRAMGRFDEAIEERSRALALDPLSVRTGMSLGSDFYLAGDLTRAAEQFRRAMELEPHAPPVVGEGPQSGVGMGHVHERRGEPELALNAYLRADSLAGVDVGALAALRRAYESAGLPGYWRQRIAQLSAAPGVAPNPFRLSWMLQRAGDREGAIRALERGYRERTMAMVFMAVTPDLASLADDPRVRRVREAMQLHGVRARAEAR